MLRALRGHARNLDESWQETFAAGDPTYNGDLTMQGPTNAAAGSTTSLSQSATNNVWVDASGNAATVQLPSAPRDGDIAIIKLIGAGVAGFYPNAVSVVARGGAAVEDPQAWGTFSANNGTVTANAVGQTLWFQFQASNVRWADIT